MKTTIHFNMFKIVVYVLIGEWDDIKKGIPKAERDSFTNEDYVAKVVSIGGTKKYLERFVIHSKEKYISTIAHEAVHVANFSLSHLGFAPSFAEDELQAYMVQRITERVEYNLLKEDNG